MSARQQVLKIGGVLGSGVSHPLIRMNSKECNRERRRWSSHPPDRLIASRRRARVGGRRRN